MRNPIRREPIVDREDAAGEGLEGSLYLGSTENTPEPAVELSRSDIGGIYQRIRAAAASQRGLVVLLMSPHPKAGVTSIAYAIGRVAAESSGQRVLLCDATGTEALMRLSRIVLRRSLTKLAAYEGFAIPPGLVACPLDLGRTPPEMLSSISVYAEALRKFRSVFDLVIVDAPSSRESSLGTVLSKHADAAVIVVEADRTRAPAVAALVSAIRNGGGNVAGTVLNKRIQHIPESVYRWL